MPKSNIIKALEQLDKKDIYSLILFILYKLKETPEYATLSELIYILDNENFIKLINYYGGKTIKIPTLSELSNVLNALIVYERQQNTDQKLTEILNDLEIEDKSKSEVIAALSKVSSIMEEYDFRREIK